jgi:GTP-binding protein
MPTVAIIGRPNAGKSTLFNSLLGERRAIESDVPGTTRDRVFGTIKGHKLDFLLVDTGGLTTDTNNSIEEDMKRQAEESIAGADLIYFCIDVRTELTAEEEEVVRILRQKKPKHIPVFLVGTKAEKPNAMDVAGDLYCLGITDHDIFFVSAKERIGTDDLLEETETVLLQNGFQKKSENTPDEFVSRICILGRPNAGKSTMLNLLAGKDISIVSPESGTTRDNIDTTVRFEKDEYLLIDTAGIRKKSSMNREQIEKYSRMRALSALNRSDIAVLLIDASSGITHQDQTIASELKEAGVGVIIVFSKWDLARKKVREEVEQDIALKDAHLPEKTDPKETETQISKKSIAIRNRFVAQAQSRFPFLSWAPVLFLSSMEKRGFQEVFQSAKKIMEERTKEIPTRELNIFLEQALATHAPAAKKNAKLKVKYATQAAINPPKFLFFANDPDSAHFSFRRYLENRLRDVYGFWGTPIQIEIRRK